MISPELAQLERNPEWQQLLATYAGAVATAEGWIERIAELPGINAEQVSRIHGKLIAWGLLDFQLGALAEGVQYQLTSLARQALQPRMESAEPETEAA